jgi:RhtB (resistance to homoserine/threonine) family protein
MNMSDFNYWLLFLSAAVALNIAPGPDLLYILTKTMTKGKKIGIASALGVCTGAFFHVLLAAFGISTVIASSPIAFTVIKSLGVIYLLFLAYQSFRSSGMHLSLTDDSNTVQETAFSAFKQGILIDLFNPKVAIFFMAFLPQLVRNEHGSVPFQLLFLGSIIIVIAIIIETIYVLLASKLTEKMRHNKKISLWFDRLVGTLFLGLGIKLATDTA